MSGRTKQHPIKENKYHIVVEGPRRKRLSLWISEEGFAELKTFLAKQSRSGSVTWDELASDRIAKHGKAGLALRGARLREGISQKELAKRSGVSQENISRMENGKRPIGMVVAEKLAAVLHIDIRLLTTSKE